MHFDISSEYKARQLFKFEILPVAKPGRPEFTNLKAVSRKEWNGKPELEGPGIYGVFCKGHLAYVGIYTGHQGKTFTGTVFHRWSKHLTYFSMRTPELAFSPRNMRSILQCLPRHPFDEFVPLLSENLTLPELVALDVPLLRGRSCTFKKALFACSHWDIFAPGHEEKMLDEISFVYARFLPSIAWKLPQEKGYNWVKSNWLKKRESSLINRFRPVCNSVKGISEPTTVKHFVDALRDEMVKRLDEFA